VEAVKVITSAGDGEVVILEKWRKTLLFTGEFPNNQHHLISIQPNRG
jgi:hypothetical protein